MHPQAGVDDFLLEEGLLASICFGYKHHLNFSISACKARTHKWGCGSLARVRSAIDYSILNVEIFQGWVVDLFLAADVCGRTVCQLLIVCVQISPTFVQSSIVCLAAHQIKRNILVKIGKLLPVS
jgi:hypothetical protein